MTTKITVESLSKKTIAKVRSIAIAKSGINCTNAKVVVVKGSKAPFMLGRGFYFRNKRGDVIQYPMAYARKCGNPIYVSSTKRVEVGERWLEKLAQKLAQKDAKRLEKVAKKEFLRKNGKMMVESFFAGRMIIL